jgi:hypothetical protein
MVVASAALVVCLGIVAQAGPPGGGSLTSGWTVSAGVESQSLRDISRGGPPVDASPVSWRGSGPSLSIGYERGARRRLHRATLDVSQAGSFAYLGPIHRVAASGDDGLNRVEGRYEYRRYPFDDLLMRGLHAGIGVQGIGRHLTYTRRASTFAIQRNSETTAAAAVVAAVRVDRWTRWTADLEWVNGISTTYGTQRLDIDTLADLRGHGGGWLTDLSARFTVRVASTLALTVTYLRADEGTMLSSNASATARRRVIAGVTYAR